MNSLKEIPDELYFRVNYEWNLDDFIVKGGMIFETSESKKAAVRKMEHSDSD